MRKNVVTKRMAREIFQKGYVVTRRYQYYEESDGNVWRIPVELLDTVEALNIDNCELVCTRQELNYLAFFRKEVINMLAEPIVELLDGVVNVYGHGVAIISYDKRELYAVRVKDIVINNDTNSIEFQTPEYINSGGDIVRDKHYMKMDKVEITLL